MKTNAIATVVATLLLVASCGGEPEVIEPDPTSSSPTAPSTPPPMPHQATLDTKEGAVAAAAHWVHLFNFASRTGDVEALNSYSQGCGPCLRYARTIETIAAEDRPAADPWTIEEVEGRKDADASDVRMRIDILGRSSEEIAFELSPRAPYEIRDLYVVAGGR